ncbi:MAG: SDR family oxidoreductase [Muribaculum sp.]|nr:SDR family oxidoreductase [Muribaculum sp.]
MKRFGTPEEIADTILFLCSARSAFTTGTIVQVDGGQGTGY